MFADLTIQIATRPELPFLAAVFAAVSLLAFVIINFTRAWADVRRRASAQTSALLEGPLPGNSILLGKATSNGIFDAILPQKESEKSELRKFLGMAGYRSPLAPAILQLLRIATAVLLGVLTAANFDIVLPNQPFVFLVGMTLLMTLAGYILPRAIVSFRRDALIEEHRQGFPDFLDLLVICIEAGVGIDSAIDRVGQDMASNYPSLSYNLVSMSLEMRAGRSLREALENLSERLGIEEAKSFATLLHQSEELGSSLVQSLRVYADEMRSKRLARAEEKAHALPAKLVIPLGLFIFPVILGVVLTPVVIKIYKALGI